MGTRGAGCRVALAVLAYLAIPLLWWWRQRRAAAWNEAMLAQNCSPVVPMVDVVAAGWAGGGLAVLAACLLVSVAVSMHRRGAAASGWVSAVAAVALIGAVVGVGGVWMLPTSASEGTDGSGWPCPAG